MQYVEHRVCIDMRNRISNEIKMNISHEIFFGVNQYMTDTVWLHVSLLYNCYVKGGINETCY